MQKNKIYIYKGTSDTTIKDIRRQRKTRKDEEPKEKRARKKEARQMTLPVSVSLN